ncbi:MAG: hypothetical protein K0Q46_4630 [Rhodococcus erythropolis]|jgi:hypothetical protein|nr:hypothetical protein [Rhodococcus erythropolis]
MAREQAEYAVGLASQQGPNRIRCEVPTTAHTHRRPHTKNRPPHPAPLPLRSLEWSRKSSYKSPQNTTPVLLSFLQSILRAGDGLSFSPSSSMASSAGRRDR